MICGIYLKVEPLPACRTEQVCADVCRLASQLGITVSCQFNAYELVASPGDDPAALDRAYRSACARRLPVGYIVGARDA